MEKKREYIYIYMLPILPISFLYQYHYPRPTRLVRVFGQEEGWQKNIARLGLASELAPCSPCSSISRESG